MGIIAGVGISTIRFGSVCEADRPSLIAMLILLFPTLMLFKYCIPEFNFHNTVAT